MKDKVVNFLILIIIFIALPVSYFIGYNSFKTENKVNNDINLKDKNKYISRESAKDAAFKHAIVTESEVTDLSVELDIEHHRVIYDISFDHKGYEYEYEVNALTGEVVSYFKEKEEVIVKTTTKKKTTTTKKTTVSKISKEKAKSIALKDAGVNEKDIKDYEIEYDYEKGKYIYEIDFESGKYDYSYDIDANTGKIINKEKERDN